MKDLNWAEELSCAVTVCDLEANIIYQNSKARQTFQTYGDLTGKNLKDCHGERAWNMIVEMLERGSSNSYTIEKRGVKKLIHQTPWYINGDVAGLVELSFEIPEELPHFIRG